MANYDAAYALAKKYMKYYPDVLLFHYHAAVFTAEEETGFTEKQIRLRQDSAAKQLRKLLRKLNGADPKLRAAIRNEYYWFSRQPYKQYLLGKEMVRKGIKKAYYSQGVGAAMLAQKYGKQGRQKLCVRWAQRSEKAWIRYFKIIPNWHNAYFFYAMALGYQGKIKQMDTALKRAATIAGKTEKWKTILEIREKIEQVVENLNK